MVADLAALHVGHIAQEHDTAAVDARLEVVSGTNKLPAPSSRWISRWSPIAAAVLATSSGRPTAATSSHQLGHALALAGVTRPGTPAHQLASAR